MTSDENDSSVYMDSFEEEAIPIDQGLANSASRTSPFQIIFWGMVSTFCIALIAFFVVFRSQMQENQFIAELENQGADVRTAINPPKWLKSVVIDYPSIRNWFQTIGSIKIDSIDVSDEQIKQLAQSPFLRQATIKSDTLTREGLFNLGEAPQLRNLSLISCPKITRKDLAEFERKFPDIVTSWRGNAFLGIRSYQTPNYHQISSIMPDSPAERAGLRRHDRITAVDGNSVSSFNGLVEQLRHYDSGDIVSVDILRGLEPIKLEVELGSWTNQI